ncbi:hypothetical protein KA107_00450 [Candidatus Pacearchaeota archaeon]|nr:hypothetical protein [Candidatus Pacearchaeota archaeon]
MIKSKPNTRFSLGSMSNEQFNGVISALQYCLSGGLKIDRSSLTKPNISRLVESLNNTGPLDSKEIKFPVTNSERSVGDCVLKFSTELYLGNRYAHVEAKPHYPGSKGISASFEDRIRKIYAEPFDSSRSFDLQLRRAG